MSGVARGWGPAGQSLVMAGGYGTWASVEERGGTSKNAGRVVPVWSRATRRQPPDSGT